MLIPYLSHCFLCLMFFCFVLLFLGGGVGGEALKGREREKVDKFIPKIYELVWSLLNLKAGFCIFQPALDDHPVQNYCRLAHSFFKNKSNEKNLRHKGKLALFENNLEGVFSHPLKQIAFFSHNEKRQAKFLKRNVLD